MFEKEGFMSHCFNFVAVSDKGAPLSFQVQIDQTQEDAIIGRGKELKIRNIVNNSGLSPDLQDKLTEIIKSQPGSGELLEKIKAQILSESDKEALTQAMLNVMPKGWSNTRKNWDEKDRDERLLSVAEATIGKVAFTIDMTVRKILAKSLENPTLDAKRLINITIEEVDEKGIHYSIDSQNACVSLEPFSEKEISLLQKHKVQIQTKDVKESSEKSLLRRFSTSSRKMSGIEQVFANFFSALLWPFTILGMIWELATRDSAKNLKQDLDLLAEICGTPMPKRVTMLQSLKYISTLLNRESQEMADPVLQKRFQSALKIGESLARAQGSRQSTRIASVRRISAKIKKSIPEGDTKILIPVGYRKNGVFVEALLEVVKEPNKDTYTVTLLSADEEIRGFFDTAKDPNVKTQSLRREIQGVQKKDLEAAIDTFVELQVLHADIDKHQDRDFEEVFFTTLRFDQSIVKESTPTECYTDTGVLHSPFTGALSYATQEKIAGKEDKLFGLSARLELFLSIYKKNKNSCKDPTFWLNVKTTLFELTRLIEQEGTLEDPGSDLAKIAAELNLIAQEIDQARPEVPVLSRQALNLARCFISLPTHEVTPPLRKGVVKGSCLKMQNDFIDFDLTKPVESAQKWADRCRELIGKKYFEEAGFEAKLMVYMMNSLNISLKTDDEKIKFLEACYQIAQAIERAADKKDQATLQDLIALEVLQCQMMHIVAGGNPLKSKFTSLCDESITAIKELLQCHLIAGRKTCQGIQEKYQGLKVNKDPNLKYTRNEGSLLQMLENMRALARKIKEKHNISENYNMPLTLCAPSYAKAVTEEVTCRNVTEFCCLGCIGDNCPNYADIEKSRQRYNPPFLIHNFTNAYCPTLTREVSSKTMAELLYCQQTNQDGMAIALGGRPLESSLRNMDQSLGYADRFDKNDRSIQVVNIFTSFLKNPDLLKDSKMRWLFENKLFTHDVLRIMLSTETVIQTKANRDGSSNKERFTYQEAYEEFFHGVLSQLRKQITLFSSAKEYETAGYLIDIYSEIKQAINESQESPAKERLLASSIADFSENLDEMATEITSGTEKYLSCHQAMILPLTLQKYYQKFIENPSDTSFEDPATLQLILAMHLRIEVQAQQKKDIDPEWKDCYQALATFSLRKAKEMIGKEKNPGEFVNGILMHFNPAIANKGLAWSCEGFPVAFALDANKEAYSFDLKTGDLNFGNKQLKTLPLKLQTNSQLIEIYGDKVKGSWTLQSGVVEKKKEEPFSYIRAIFAKKAALSPKPIDKRETVLVYEHPEFSNLRVVVTGENSKNVFIERKLVSPGKKENWVVYEPTIEENIPFPLEGRHCWVDRSRKNIYILDNKTDQPYAIGKVAPFKRGALTPLEVKDFHILAGNYHVLSCQEKELQQFSPIENPKNIQVLGKVNRFSNKCTPTTVVYPRYTLSLGGAPLSLNLNPKKGDYHLAPFGKRPGSQNPILGVSTLPAMFSAFLLLQKNGNEKVLIPFCNFIQKYSVYGEPLSSTAPEFSEANLVLEFSVNQETNRLEAKSGSGYAFLAYLCLTHRDYAGALHYLSKARSTAGYEADYDKIFEWVQKIDDKSASGVALQLHFALFQEKVLEDRKMHTIVHKGKAGENVIENPARIGKIVDLYHRYSEFMTNQKEEVDPQLDFSITEKKEIKGWILAFLSQHGEALIDESFTFTRAKEISQQTFHEVSKDTDHLQIRNAAKLLWKETGTHRSKTSLTLQDPLWVVQNFQSLFNRILKEDTNSEEYQLMKRQIRMISPNTEETVLTAQTTLLQLMNVKEKDEGLFNKIEEELGESKSLVINRHFFSQSMQYAERKMMSILKFLTKPALHDPTMLSSEAWQYYTGDPKNRDPLFQVSLAKEIEKFAKKHQDLILNEEGIQDFFGLLKTFLGEKIYGTKSLESLIQLSTILELLENQNIDQPQQNLEAGSFSPSPPLTYKQKYGSLIQGLSEESFSVKAKIAELERSIEARKEQVKPVLVKTDPLKIKPVIVLTRDYFNTPPIQAIDVDQSLFQDLEQSQEPAVVRVAKENREDLEAYLGIKKRGAITRKEDIAALQKELTNLQQETASKKEILERDLLQFVDHFSKDIRFTAIRRLVGKDVKISLDVLIAYWRRGDITKEWEENPFKELGIKKMSPEVLKRLDAQVAEYLKLSTEKDHLDRVLGLTNDLLSAAKGKGAIAADELYAALQTKRQYALSHDADYRDLLYVEYTQKIILYADQIQMMREMSESPNAVRQLRMGRGKTEVIMPILAKRKATGKNLVVLLWPEDLYETNCRGSDSKNRVLFGQEMHRFEFSLKTDKSLESLESIYAQLLTTIDQKGFVMSTKRSLLSLKNSYVMLQHQLSDLKAGDDEGQIIAQIRAMNKIVSLFSEKADVLADEIDECLDVRKEVNFAIGENTPIDSVKGEVGGELIDSILEAKEGDPLFELQQNLICNTQASLPADKLQIAIIAMAKSYYQKHKSEVGFSEGEFCDYINNTQPAGGKVDAWLLRQKSQNPDLFQRWTTAKAFLTKGFSSTFTKVGNVKYGRDPVSKIYTIPYKASNSPSINSEFDEDIERISFIYQDYLQNDVLYEPIYQIVAQARKKGLEELTARDDEQNLTLVKTKEGEKFQKFLQSIDPEGELKHLSLSNMNNPAMVEILVNFLNKSSQRRLLFVRNFVIPKLMQFPEQINSISTEVPGLVRNFGGFTGTPWNLHTYHDKLEAKPNLGVDGETWALLLQKQVPIHVFTFDAKKPIDSLLDNLDVLGNYQAVIDAGAYLRGTSNEEFVNKALQKAKSTNKAVSAGVYFDETGKIVKKQDATEEAVSIGLASVTPLKEQITLYDQAHTVGADITQDKQAKAIVTIGENTFIRDLFQAVWRLRQVNKQQTVEFAVSDKIKAMILDGNSRDLTVQDILKFCLSNQVAREGDDNFKSEKDKITGHTKRALLPTVVSLIEKGVSDAMIKEMAQEFFSSKAELFIKRKPQEEAYESYGKMTSDQDPQAVLTQLKEKETSKEDRVSRAFSGMLTKYEAQNFIGFENAWDSVAERGEKPSNWFPRKVAGKEDSGAMVEQEQEQEQEVAVLLELEMETQKEKMVQKEINVVIPNFGKAGSGDVHPITESDIQDLVGRDFLAYLLNIAQTMTADKKSSPFRQIGGSLPFFSDQMFCSSVFERNFKNGEKAYPQSIFYTKRKPVLSVLIVKNKKGDWRLLIPTAHEQHGACRRFVKCTQNQAVQVAITNQASPFIYYKSGKTPSQDLPFVGEDRKQFYLLYVQAKLFNGEITYSSKEEKEELKAFLKNKQNAKGFQKFFESNILPATFYIEAYKDSDLLKIFNEMQEETL